MPNWRDTIEDRPALGAYQPPGWERTARGDWVRWLIAEHTARVNAERVAAAEGLAACLAQRAATPAELAQQLRELAERLEVDA